LRNWKNWIGSRKFTQIAYLPFVEKIGPVDTEIALLIVKKINKKKKFWKVKYRPIAQSAGLPSALKSYPRTSIA